jgi:uncharacterized membrane protein YqjE
MAGCFSSDGSEMMFVAFEVMGVLRMMIRMFDERVPVFKVLVYQCSIFLAWMLRLSRSCDHWLVRQGIRDVHGDHDFLV